MAKKKETDLVEEIREEEQLETKGPLRDDPEPAYSPAWEVVNDRQNILTDKIPPKIYSLEALMAAGIVTEESLAEAGYVKNTDYASALVGGVVKLPTSRGLAIESNGSMYTSTFTLANYNTTGSGTFIGKGTLENIRTDLFKRSIIDTVDPAGVGPDGLYVIAGIRKLNGEYSFVVTTPE